VCGVVRYSVFCSRLLVIFFLVAEFVEKRQLGVVWVFFFLCGYGVFEFLDFESQIYCCGRRVRAGVFLGVCCFCGVCARLFFSVDGG